MTSSKAATVFRWAAAVGLFLTAAGHASARGKMSNDPSCLRVCLWRGQKRTLLEAIVAGWPRR